MKAHRSKIWSHFPWQFYVDASLDGQSCKNGKINVLNLQYRFDGNENLVLQKISFKGNHLYSFLS